MKIFKDTRHRNESQISATIAKRNTMFIVQIVTVVVILSSVGLVYAQPPLRLKHFNVDEGVALEGYDPVSYFRSSKPVRGNASITHSHEGIKYCFSSEQNKKLFITSPDSYEAAYGGWCAYAMGARGEKVEVDPETFKIIDGRLFLFYNKYFTNTLDSWNKDEAKLKANADVQWKRISSK